MKKYTLYILVALLGLTVSSCDKYLDITPVGKVIPTTAEEYRALLTEAYSTVPDDRGLASFRADELRLDATMSTYDLDSYLDIYTWNDATPGENTSSFKWRQFYHVLFIANYVIENERNITTGSAAEISQLIGEAYMLRAYMHFLLANLHAPAYTKCDPSSTKAVPLKLDSDVETVLSRSTLEQVYASVTGDLDKAATYLNVESWPDGYNYRFNTLSVDALRSRVALYMGDWDEAQAAAERVLAVKSALTDVNSVLPNVYNSIEAIVSLEQVMPAAYERPIKVDNNFYGLFTSADQRRRTYFKAESSSVVSLRKGGSNTYTSTLRTGEMYLNSAEAACRQGDLDAARGRLLDLQRARFNASGYTQKETDVNAMDRDALLEEILTERARELAFEGHRWFDLRRTTQPRLERTFKGQTYVLEEGDSRYTIPIPSEAIQANPGLAY
ncbi:MAG: RagB/SusD family nutrient uptake outer membrane protein [Bacteroides sp.]|nr:RagB/SusD family nutrient uptake outer membrane protein [Bacteroides sp.]